MAVVYPTVHGASDGPRSTAAAAMLVANLAHLYADQSNEPTAARAKAIQRLNRLVAQADRRGLLPRDETF